MSQISTCLWFDGRAEEAMAFYLDLIPGSRVVDVMHWGETGPGTPGSLLMARLELGGMSLQLLNGGPQYTLSPAVSLSVDCEDQAELDRIWGRLLEVGGTTLQCGWITDPWGLSWQIVPRPLPAWLRDPDPVVAARVMNAMFGMVKLEFEGLRRAYLGI
jgi:predicted 3-demethylubiquinone-9 3-methyltransferase (glyoxalase superfamily)